MLPKINIKKMFPYISSRTINYILRNFILAEHAAM